MSRWPGFWPVGALLFSFVVSLPVLVQRSRIETQDRGVLLVLDFNGFYSKAAQEGYTLDRFAAEVKPLDATLAVSEERFKDLAITGSVQMTEADHGIRLKGNDEAATRRLGEALRFHFAPESYESEPGGWLYRGRLPDLDEAGGSFDWNVIAHLRAANVPILLRPYNSKLATPESLKALLGAMTQATGARILIAEGDEAPGYPSPANYRAVVQSWGGFIGDVEFSDQKGLENLLALDLDKDFKVHSISDRELPNYTPEKAMARYLRAVRERKVRVLYLNALPGFSFSENVRFVESLARNLSADGFTVGDMTVETYSPPTLLLLALTIGIAATLVLFVRAQAWNRIYRVGLAAVVMAGAGLATQPGFAGRLPLAILAAGLLPFLFLTWCWRARRLNWLGLTAMNYALGLALSAYLTTTPLLRGVALLSGVKLALLLPPALAFAWALSPKLAKEEFKKVTMSALDFAWLLVAGGALAYIAIRSGNVTGFKLPGEEKARDLLEKWLPVRPRSKEMIGHPALIYVGSRERGSGSVVYGLWLALGVLAQSNLVNSFFHVHTPLTATVIRSLLGILIGGLVGWGIVAIERSYGRVLGRLFSSR